LTIARHPFTLRARKEMEGTMTKLVGIGECMIELSQAGDGLLRKSFAGDVVNTLWYARAPGMHCAFFTGLGTDAMSEEMIAFLQSNDISCAQIARIEARNPGLYMIQLDGAERSFSYWRDTSAARMLAHDPPLMTRAIDSADALYFSGITLAILPGADRANLIDALHKARAAGKPVAFDPNIRPKLWPDPAKMREAITDAVSCASLVLPSFDDEAAAFGDASPIETAKRYQRAGADLVIVKDGPNPTLICGADGDHTIDTPHVAAPVDTTGAGDSFNGAFLSAYLLDGDAIAAVRAAQACAGRVICHHGALM
jgi:2-dehydro-3-deoxygluconokinase